MSNPIRHLIAAAIAVSCFGAAMLAQAPATRAPGIYVAPAGAPFDDSAVRLHGQTMTMKQGGTAKMMLLGGRGSSPMTGSVTGSAAKVRAQRDSIFYFHIDPEAGPRANDPSSLDFSNLNKMADYGRGDFVPETAKSAGEFVLVRMRLNKDGREAEVATASAGGTKTSYKDAVTFDVEKLDAKNFKVVPKTPLEPGEYGFFYGDSRNGTSGQLWDFGVDAK